ncbi:Srp9 [Culex quinquefasciatus]|uniref:Signal recognition particle 9 kDa protein n=2 Tax=Culex TaxID=53527 RepID=B0WNT2_CULQU|nr:signal recognition particle 9 kDa protein [Culex quinquefasciatus]XP_039444158.1 signal recognition particle 9 kDa protein [Culex pipiens pallens]EDS31923.1 Srp9 [Culex quinquefasciatus]|eukprot:XP_001850366.1 Srp9 [Culex quinquefasciatus]
MVFAKSWEDFEIAAENMYIANPCQCRFTMKYTHQKNQVVLKLTDNVKCVQFKTEVLSDLKRIEKFSGNLMWLMASKE